MPSITQGPDSAKNQHENTSPVGERDTAQAGTRSHAGGGYEVAFDDDLRPFSPPCTNRGGKSQSPVNSGIRKTNPPTRVNAIIDYLSFTFSLDEVVTRRRVKRMKKHPVRPDGKLAAPVYSPAPDDYHGDDVQFVRERTDSDVEVGRMLQVLQSHVSHLQYIKSDKGLFGYRKSVSLYRDGQHCGKVAYDGNKGTCLVSLSGKGTSGVDMAKMRAFMERLPQVKITRVDMAHDDLEGELPIEYWLGQFEQGEFNTGGRDPSRRLMDDFGSGAGRTFYVGRLSNGKEACIYEKGKQLGDKASPWVRVEGRLSNQDRVIPLEVLTEPDTYLAGLYPAFSYLCAFWERVKVIKRHLEIAAEQAIHYAKVQAGPVVYMMECLGRTAEEIVATLRREQLPKRLEAVPLAA